jgi:hypothetical protein
MNLEEELYDDLSNLYAVMCTLMLKYNFNTAKKIDKFLGIKGSGVPIMEGRIEMISREQYIEFISKLIFHGLTNGK